MGMAIHFLYETQIALLQADKTFIKFFFKYLDYIDIFLFDLAIELPEQNNKNNHIIKLKKGKQLPCKLIYSLDSVKLENLKTYIKTYLKIKFI